MVIVGGGQPALEVAAALGALAPGLVRPVLVTDQESFAYRPLGTGEPYGLGPPQRYALADVARDLGADLLASAVARVDPGTRTVVLDGGELVAYETLVLGAAAGARRAFAHGVAFDRAGDAGPYDRVALDVEAGLVGSIAFVVPADVTWPLPAYELALATAATGARSRRDGIAVTVVTAEAAPLSLFGPCPSRLVTRALEDAGIAVVAGVRARVVSHTTLVAGVRWLEADRIVSLPHARGPAVAGMPADAHGYLPVDACGHVDGLADVYAAGDGTTIAVRQSGVVSQQAGVVAGHVAAAHGARLHPVALDPVVRGLLRTPSGPLYLRRVLSEPDGIASGEPLWWPPARLASRWLAPALAPRSGVAAATPGSVVARSGHAA